MDYSRARKGPALVHAHVIRPYSHSLSDDEVQYRAAGRARGATRSAIRWHASRGTCCEQGIATEAELDAHRAAGGGGGRRSPPTSRSRRRSRRPSTVYDYVYSPDVDPTSEQFDTEDDPRFAGDPTTMVDLLNACLRDEMTRDPRIVVFGEDVADCSREEASAEVKGKGGVFKVTWGLQRAFGGDRVYNSPLAEANIVGRAIGLATARAQAGGRDPVLRLHLAGVHADPERAGDYALALEQRVGVPGRHPRHVRRVPQGRRGLPLADGRRGLHPHPRAARRLSRPTRWTPTACCAPRSAARIR